MSNLVIVPTNPNKGASHKLMYDRLPQGILDYTSFQFVSQIEIDEDVEDKPFLYESMQYKMISKLVSEKAVKDGDTFLFMDYANPMVQCLRGSLRLNCIDARIVGYCDSVSVNDTNWTSSNWDYKVFAATVSSYNAVVFSSKRIMDSFLSIYGTHDLANWIHLDPFDDTHFYKVLESFNA